MALCKAYSSAEKKLLVKGKTKLKVFEGVTNATNCNYYFNSEVRLGFVIEGMVFIFIEFV